MKCQPSMLPLYPLRSGGTERISATPTELKTWFADAKTTTQNKQPLTYRRTYDQVPGIPYRTPGTGYIAYPCLVVCDHRAEQPAVGTSRSTYGSSTEKKRQQCVARVWFQHEKGSLLKNEKTPQKHQNPFIAYVHRLR